MAPIWFFAKMIASDFLGKWVINESLSALLDYAFVINANDDINIYVVIFLYCMHLISCAFLKYNCAISTTINNNTFFISTSTFYYNFAIAYTTSFSTNLVHV